MSQPFHTPYLRASFPPIDSLQRTKLYGPKHPDGGEYAPVCEIADENLARGIAAAYNAFDSAAQRLGLNAVEFAERMADGALADLLESHNDMLYRFHSCISDGNGEIDGDKGAMARARAVIEKVKGINL